MRALAIAATGMSAQQTNVEVIANNIANINTTGFKRGKAEFTDLLYEAERLQGHLQPGATATSCRKGPNSAWVSAPPPSATCRPRANSPIRATPTIWPCRARGWFQVTGPNGDLVYTRAGAFNTNATGQLVTLDGYTVNPSIVVPPNTTAVTVSQSGHRVGLRSRATRRPCNWAS